MTTKRRKLKLSNGATASVSLAKEEWAVVEWVARAQAMGWSVWARDVIDANPHNANRAALLRRSALEHAFGEAMFAERADLIGQSGELPHPMLQGRLWPLTTEAALVAQLESLKVSYRADFTSFELIAGHQNSGPVVILRNKLAGAPSAILTQDILANGMDRETCMRGLPTRSPREPLKALNRADGSCPPRKPE